MKNDGVSVMAVGVGNYVDRSFLESMASNSAYVNLASAGYSGLTIAGDVISTACVDPPAPDVKMSDRFYCRYYAEVGVVCFCNVNGRMVPTNGTQCRG